jgi:hypothetical protein
MWTQLIACGRRAEVPLTMSPPTDPIGNRYRRRAYHERSACSRSGTSLIRALLRCTLRAMARRERQRNPMVRIQLSIDLSYQIQSPPGADFIFNIQAAHMAQQTVVWEQLGVSQPVTLLRACLQSFHKG